ncbi:MAG TPA: hypothetical protein VK867_10380 [Candidatus Limnocylindrales bacterium]|nr:hypothetical protein [Candidatus Limnocylindrales bacterium]
MADPQALRHTSDALLAQLSELEELERTKRALQPGSRAQVRLSRRVESLARKVLSIAGQQTDLVETIAEMADETSGHQTREPHVILSEWRVAERAMEAEKPGSSAWQSARADVDRLRAEYRRAFTERGRRD